MWGKDESANVKIESDLNVAVEGTYFIVYTIDTFKYKNVQKVRVINVVAPATEA